MRAAFYTLGCKVNQYETQILSQHFAANGYDIVEPTELADVYIINSCTVTAEGDRKTRQAIRRMKRLNPGAVVALTGCFPQAFPQDAEKIIEADIITGASERRGITKLIQQFLLDGNRIIQIPPHDRAETFEPMHANHFLDRTRAFVKIQDGCEHYCSYCIIPYARGFCRSKPLEDLKLELYELANQGYQEVVLVGIDLSSYGKDLGLHLIDAVTLACTTQGIQRVRLGSLEPLLLTDENLALLAGLEHFCPQFHLSLQSGCDATLARMNRHYDTQFYRELVAKIRHNFTNPAITTDIMVGFPGETEEEFQQSLAFAEEIAFAKVHVFPYSIRPGTRAAKMNDQVSRQDKEIRSHQMAKTTNLSRLSFLQSQVGLTEAVLFETDMIDGRYTGYTSNYTPVHVSSDRDIRGQILPVKITDALADFCIGEL